MCSELVVKMMVLTKFYNKKKTLGLIQLARGELWWYQVATVLYTEVVTVLVKPGMK